MVRFQALMIPLLDAPPVPSRWLNSTKKKCLQDRVRKKRLLNNGTAKLIRALNTYPFGMAILGIIEQHPTNSGAEKQYDAALTKALGFPQTWKHDPLGLP